MVRNACSKHQIIIQIQQLRHAWLCDGTSALAKNPALRQSKALP
jgi:hypothetical protein